MLKEIADQFNDEILVEAARRYGANPEALTELEGFENYIYEYAHQGQDYILRIGHSLRRTAPYTMGEIEWLNYLADHGAPVARAIRSLDGRWLETIPSGESAGYFVVTSFERAAGHILDDVPEAKARYWNTGLFETWGRAMGAIHALSKEFRLSNPAFKRQEWHEYDVLDLQAFIPPDQTLVLERASRHLDKLHTLPSDAGSYGLIHADLTQWNFCVDDGAITIFDFDSCEYSWFVKDIAVSLYYARASDENGDSQDFIHDFMYSFLKGYRRECDLEAHWLRLIPDFLMLQKIILYAFCYQILDMGNLSAEDQEFLLKTRQIIEENSLEVDFDFGDLV